ncbi:MAG: TIGR04282 family arsenosugar biosynthesis glycosyltransferase [Pseudomonadota bacterium]
MTLSISLHLLARAPEPGRVKTRLIPALGEEGASNLQRVLVERALALPALAFSDRFLWLAEGPDEALEALAAAHGWTVVGQPAGDLGERMRCIVALGLAESEGVVLIGNDCPALDGDYLAAACDGLNRHDAVLGPAEDGGYVLLGLRRVDGLLFEDMPWGTERVLELTRERLLQLGWSLGLLPVLWDVDRPQDLPRLAAVGIDLDQI